MFKISFEEGLGFCWDPSHLLANKDFYWLKSASEQSSLVDTPQQNTVPEDKTSMSQEKRLPGQAARNEKLTKHIDPRGADEWLGRARSEETGLILLALAVWGQPVA